MALSPQIKRAADAAADAKRKTLKAEYRDRFDRIQGAFSPALSNGELALGLELALAEVGRIKSENPRSRAVVPDFATQAIVDRALSGECVVAVGPPPAGSRRRQVLFCTQVEAKRLGWEWAVRNLAGGDTGRERAADADAWEEADVWNVFGGGTPEPKTEKALAPAPPTPTSAPVETKRRDRVPLREPPPDLGRVGFGAMRLSTAGRPDRADALKVLHAAFDAGLRFVDTANVYAEDEHDIGHNEALVSEAIATWSGPRETIVVGTKGGLVRRGPRWLPDTRPEGLKAACEASLSALGVERIELYQLHVVDKRVPLADSVGALLDLQNEGKIRHIGLCNVDAAQLEEAWTIAPIATVQCKASLYDPKPFTQRVVELCGERGLRFIAHSPVGGHRGVKRLLSDAVVAEVAERHGVRPHAVALAWQLAGAEHVVPIPGATKVESVRGIVEGMKLKLDVADRAVLDARYPFRPRARSERGARVEAGADAGEVVVVLGSPAGGKTTHVTPFVEKGYVRLNRDELGGKLDGLPPRLEEAAHRGERRFVLDNTYPTKRSRAKLLATAKRLNLPVRCIWLDVPAEHARFNAARRIWQRHGRMLSPEEIAEASKADPNIFPPIVINAWRRRFEPPIVEEGFVDVERVPFERRLGEGYVNKALVLDYDGTLRTTKSGEIYPRDPDDVALLPGRREVLERYLADGYRLLGISNQSGVSSGKLSLEAAAACIERTHELLGLDIEGHFCPHPAGPPKCWCRKPMPGLGVQFIESHRLDPTQAVMVGDLSSDEAFAAAAGFRFMHADAFFGDD